MNKVPNVLAASIRNANYCAERAEFFKQKSNAKYRAQAAKNYQEAAELWADVEELMHELIYLRNAIIPTKIEWYYGIRLSDFRREEDETAASRQDDIRDDL